jgi:hypothetical protein
MTEKREDLWPQDFGAIEDIETPATILRKQASLLGEKTSNLVEAEVATKVDEEGRLTHTFYLVAPALGGYRYRLFTIWHDMRLYPLYVSAEGPPPPQRRTGFVSTATIRIDWLEEPERELKDEKAFKDYLREKFSSQETARVLGSMITQSREA